MGDLIYLMVTSADGFTADAAGNFDWGEPPMAVHEHVNAFTRGLSAQIYGPRMWDTMKVWQDIRPGDGGDYGDLAEAMYAYADAWRALPTHVFSRQQGEPLTGEALRELKAASGGLVSIAGPGLASVALREGEVEQVARYVAPVSVGGGTPWWPLGVSARLELLEDEVLAGGWLYLRYRVI
ncbi:dihydrofolate reductase family protein [Demequina sp.]|uniref:dihydrofolate reductase family protein n=1 Tax=Demequina sp. TaxID=2050685 RepID=UPI003D121991